MKKGHHITETMLITSVVDKTDLDAEALRHLETCPFCRKTRDQFEERLNRLSSMAGEFAPEPRRNVTVPEGGGFQGAPFFRPAWAAATLIMVIVTGMSLVFSGKSPRHMTVEELIAEREAHTVLLAEVDILEEELLPHEYRYIAGGDLEGYYDDLSEYVFPLEEEASDAWEDFLSV